MTQHPIPQDITNYKFHLIGSMTLKQFAEVAASVILSLIVYKTNLIDIVKWPLVFLIVGIGVLVAFVPLEERPMDHWIKTFFKNIYKPTKFFWKKTSKVPEFFNYAITSTQANFFAPNINLNPARKQRVFEYLKSMPDEEKADDYDLEENQKINEIIKEFDNVQVNQSEVKVEAKQQEKPSLKTRVRKLKAPTSQTFVLNNDHIPNQIFGLIMDRAGLAIPQAIIEIKNQFGVSLRILKSDENGNFSTNKPLANGNYSVVAEKDENKYPIIQVELIGEILNPLVIRP
jgi:hypothetical protein